MYIGDILYACNSQPSACQGLQMFMEPSLLWLRGFVTLSLVRPAYLCQGSCVLWNDFLFALQDA